MSDENTQEVTHEQQKESDRELNFRKQEQMYEQRMQKMQSEYQAEIEKLKQRKEVLEVEDDDDEPYVDNRKLERKLSQFKSQMEQDFEKRAEAKARSLLHEEKQQSWLKQHSDFYDVIKHAEKFATEYPELAEDILAMPEGFERQKLVYRNIKTLKLHEPKKDEPSIQDKIDANRRSPYYQPSGVGTAPYQGYSGGKNFSPSEQKNAYEQMQAMKSRLRLG